MITSSRRSGSLVAAAVFVVALTACTTTPTPPTPSPTDTAAPTPPPTSPSPTTTPSPTPTPTTATCESVLDPESVAEFEALAFTPIEDFSDRMIEEGNPIALFETNGGVLCQWGIPASGSVENYALSPITAAQTETEKSRILAEGFATQPHDEGELFTGTDAVGNAQVYLFTPGFWYYGFTLDRVLEIRRNAALE